MKFEKLATLLAATAASITFGQEVAPAQVQEPAPQLEKASTLYAFSSLDVASAYIFDSGTVMNNSMVLQPDFGFGFDAFDTMPLEFDAWGNYATDRYDDMTESHCFTEIDLSIGTAHEFDCGCKIGLTLASWQYPNMDTWNGEEVLIGSLSQEIGLVKIGSDLELMVTGDCDNDYHVLPFTEVSKDFSVSDIDCSASIRGQLYYTYEEGNANHGWSSYNFTATLAILDVYAYTSYWGQMDDGIYTDEEHNIESVVYGVGYGVEI